MSLRAASSNDLIRFKESGDVISPLSIAVGSDVLECNELLRLLPAKRMVCKGRFQDKTVLLKLFFGNGYKRRWQRELNGVGLIGESEIETPKVIISDDDIKAELAYIVFEFIDAAETLGGQLLKANNEKERLTVFELALGLLAKMHEKSIYQRDVHLDNFLYSKETLYLIDGDQVEKGEAANGLSEKLVVRNLAMFFTQLYQWERSHVEPLVAEYTRQRKTTFPDNFLVLIHRQLDEYTQWREKKYIEKKVFRECGAYGVIKNWNEFCVYDKDFGQEQARRVIENPDGLIDAGDVLKSGRTAIVVKIKLANRTYVLKRYNRKSWLHQVLRSLMPSRAAISWKNGHLLGFNSIPTAKPLLLLEHRLGAFRGRSYILTEYIEGIHGADFFEITKQAERRYAVAERINILVKNLHQCGFVHGDLKAHNIWVKQDKPLLIDLDGMAKASRHLEKNKDWQRLHRDLGDSDISNSLFDGVQLLPSIK